MTQSSPSPRADAELEAALRSPEQLAFALPLTAVLGVMIVVSAVATGGSAHLVAIVAIGGFAVSAVIPMALMETFVGRPLRAALRQLRAARDGRPAPAERPFAFGLVGDLVRVAADIRAAHLNLEYQGGALARCEEMIAAGDEAIRAFRQQSEELAVAAVQESPSKRASAAQFAEFADALKALRASLPVQSFDVSVERIETMLVYLAESMERGETRDRRAEETLSRIERAFADIPRVVARETETLGGSLANAALQVRNDLASAVADDKAAQVRLIERFEGFETRVLARLADLGGADIGKFAELIRHEADSTRRALRERLEAGARAGDEREKSRIEETAADLASVGNILGNVADQLALRVAALDRLADQALPTAQGALEAATQRVEAAASAFTAPVEDPAPVGEAISKLSEEIGQRISAIEARLAAPEEVATAENVDALRVALAGRIEEAETRLLERLGAEGASEALAEAVAALQARLESAPPALDRNEIDALLQKLGASAETLAEGPGRREDDAILAPLRADLAGFAETTKELQSAIARIDALAGASAIDGLQTEVKALGEALAAPHAPDEAVAATLALILARLEAFDFAALAQALSQAVATQTDRLAAEIEALDTAGRSSAIPGDLAELPSRLESAATRIHAGAEALAALATRDGADVAALAESVIAATEALGDRLAARLDAWGAEEIAETRAHREAVADLSALVAVTSQGEADRVIACIEALDKGEIGPAREALAQAQALSSAQAARFEAGVVALNGLDFAALRADLAGVGQALAAAVAASAETLGARIAAIDSAPVDLARRSLAAASIAVAESEARLNALAARLESGLAALAATASTGALDFAALRREIGGVVEAVARAGAETATRFEAISQSLGAGVADGLQALSGAMGGLVQTGGRWGELSRQIEALAAVAAERPDFDALAQSLSDKASGAVQEAAQRFEETSRAQAVRLVERFAEFDRGVFGAMLAAFDAMTRDLAETRVRLDRSVEAVSSAADRDGEQLAGLGAEISKTAQAAFEKTAQAAFEKTAEALRYGAERFDQRLQVLDDSAIAPALAALGDGARRLGEAQARLEAVAATFEAHARGADHASSEEGAGWRAELKAVGETVAALAAEIGGRFDAFAQGQAERLQAFELKLAHRGAALDRSAVASALSMFRSMTRNLAEAVERFEAAAAARGGAEAGPDFSALRSELASVGDQVADAVERLDGRLDGFAAAQAERLEALETLIVAASADAGGAEAASASSLLRTVTQDLNAAVERFDAATGLVERRAERLQAPEVSAASDSETLWALASAVGQNNSRLETLAREQAERFEGLEAKFGVRGAAGDRSGVASALKAFRAMTRTLQDATGRFEAATTALAAGATNFGSAPPDSRSDHADGLLAMKQDLAAALEQLEQTAANLSAPASGVEPALLADVRAELRGVGETVASALAQFAARLETALAPSRDVETSGARLARPSAGATSAVAKVVLSLSDSLDLRFSEMESTLGELAAAAPTADGLTKLAEQAADAAAQLKSGLSEFAEASAAFAADGSANVGEAAREAGVGR